MKRKLFKSYEFEFDGNQKKVLATFVKQSLKQMETDDRLAREVRTFDSIAQKLESSAGKVKFTKEEKTKLVFQLKENVKHLKKKTDDAWFLTKWFYRNMHTQYKNILQILED